MNTQNMEARIVDREKTKIYLSCFPAAGWDRGDVIGYALGEDGQGLASHLSSGISWSKHDMGLTSTCKHDHYTAIYPNGFELVWIDDPDHDERWLKAVELNKTRPRDEHPEEQTSVKLTFSESKTP